MRIYYNEKIHEHDLLLYHAMRNTHPLFTSAIYEYINNAPFETKLLSRNRKIQQLNKIFKFFDLFSMPVKACNRYGNLQLIIIQEHSSPEDFQTQIHQHSLHIYSLCKAIDLISPKKFYSTFINFEDNSTKISARQLNVFPILANSDLCISEVTQNMRISPVTAHQYLAAARKTLGVKTNIAAIKMLVALGAIHFTR